MDFRPSEEQDLLRRSVREFAETEIRPHVREWDQEQHFPRELVPKLAALGLLGIQFPEHDGGAGMMAVADRAAGTKGISGFIVEKGTPAFAPGKKEDKLGMRASDTSEVLFENCRIPAEQLLGGEGKGFVNTMQVLDAGRIGIAALAVGLAQGAYEAALSYARERKAFGKTIASFQAIQWKLADAATK